MRIGKRDGFALLTVLWVLNVAGVVAAVALRFGRDTFDGTANRVEWQRGYWQASGCARRAQFAVDSILAGKSVQEAERQWRRLDRLPLRDTMSDDCRLSLEAAGTRLDVNGATREQLERLLAHTGIGDAPTIAARIMALRATQPIADVRELGSVEGIGAFSGIDSLFTVEPGLVSLANAGEAVLQTIPGVEAELAELIVRRQADDNPPNSLAELIDLTGGAADAELVARFPDASRVSTPTPSAWVWTFRVERSTGLTVTLAWRVELAGDSVRIARFEVDR